MNNILCQRIGIYARLSVRNTEREEMSIENQLLLVGQYLVHYKKFERIENFTVSPSLLF